MEVAVKTCHPTEAIHHEEKKVDPEKVLIAMRAADAYGRKRKTKKAQI
jgi:glycerol dehydrogenase-like iron-containing ADH family enzyme